MSNPQLESAVIMPEKEVAAWREATVHEMGFRRDFSVQLSIAGKDLRAIVSIYHSQIDIFGNGEIVIPLQADDSLGADFYKMVQHNQERLERHNEQAWVELGGEFCQQKGDYFFGSKGGQQDYSLSLKRNFRQTMAQEKIEWPTKPRGREISEGKPQQALFGVLQDFLDSVQKELPEMGIKILPVKVRP